MKRLLQESAILAYYDRLGAGLRADQVAELQRLPDIEVDWIFNVVYQRFWNSQVEDLL